MSQSGIGDDGTQVRPSNRIRSLGRILLLVVSMALAITVAAPSSAQAMTINTTTAKSNETGGTSVFGGIPTKVTWEAYVDSDEEVSSIDLVFPDGCDASNATVTLTVLDGLDRLDVAATNQLTDTELTIDFDTPLAAGSLLRVELTSFSLPTGVDSATFTGTYVTSDGTTKNLPESQSIELTNVTKTKRIVNWLDNQAWVQSWNKVGILRTFFKPQLIVTSVPTLFFGWLRALGLVLIGFPLAIPFGLLLALLKMGRIPVVKQLANLYINIVRGTPLFLQIYIAFFGLPLLGLEFNSYVLGFIVLAMNSSAYLAEIFRAGIQSINRGQFEAAASLGMNKAQTMFFVIIPQTVRRVIPTMTSEFILLYKDSSLLSAVGVMELMMYSKSIVANTGNMTPYIVAALYYLIVTLPLIKLVNNFERKLAREDGTSSSIDEERAARKAKRKAARAALKESSKADALEDGSGVVALEDGSKAAADVVGTDTGKRGGETP